MQIEMLGERYQLQDPIGRGGMATIYRGRDLHMDRVVAIKVLREVYSTDVKFVQRFQLEAKAASLLQHPNIVQVYDYGQSEGNYYIVMELVEGTDLRRYLRSRGVLDVDRAVIIAHDVALGLGAAHRRNIVHRDVKPQNVLVGRGGSIKLTDFGIASVYKDINAERLTTTGMTLGTVQYYAPEQAQGEIVTPAADVYALGIVMYEMLTGRTPFDGDTPVAVAMQHIQDAPIPPSQYNPNIPAALEEIILRCLEKVPEMRFRDGSQLARALETLGEADISEGVTNAATVTPGQTPLPSYRQIPPRPNSNGGRTIPPRPTSSPNNMLNGAGASQLNGADRTNGSGVDEPLLSDQQTYMLPPGAQPQATPQRPYQRGTQPRSEALQSRDSRLATIITVLIILATVILLGFSIYLASSQLHLFNLPFGGDGATPTATAPETILVPNLIGDDLASARETATSNGFVLQVQGSTTGVVKSQNPRSGDKAPRGSSIAVQMGPKTVTLPSGLVDNTLASAEAILNQAGIPYNPPIDAGNNPNKNANIVARVYPDPPNHEINVGQKVTLYVWNLNSTPTPTLSPPPSLSPSPSPTQKPSPSPTPTSRPTSAATPTSTATATPIGTLSVVPGATSQPPGQSTVGIGTSNRSNTGSDSNGVTLEVMGLWILFLIGLVRIRNRKRNGKDQS
jgi:eukaryotic-like serine/threonine-protein kinase